MVGWEDFIVQLTATLLGVIVGIPVALWLNRRYTMSKKTEERKDLLEFLKENLEDNKKILNNMLGNFDSDFIVHNRLNLATWPLFSKKINALNNLDLQKRILHTYYMLENISKKVEIKFEMHYSTFRAMQNYAQEREQLKLIIAGDIGIVNREIDEILNILSKPF